MSSDLVLPLNQAGAMASAGALAASGVVGLVWSSRNEQPGLAAMLRLCLPWPKRVAACWILARRAGGFFQGTLG